MKIISAACALVFILLCKFYWLPKSSFEKEPAILFPDPNNAFCTLRPLTAFQREMLDFRPDCLHTAFNFSCYSGATFPKQQTLLRAVKRRACETDARSLGTVPDIFKHNGHPIEPTQQPFLTVPYIRRH